MYFVTMKKVRACLALLMLAAAFYFALHEIQQYSAAVTAFKLHVMTPSPSSGARAASLEGRPHGRRASSASPTENGTSTYAPLYSDKVISPHPFHFTLSNEGVCKRNATGGRDDEVFLLILVKCRPGEGFTRAQIRDTWGGVTEVDGRRVQTMFLVGLAPNATANALVIAENRHRRDIVQEDFVDHYENLTHKTVMGWRWAAEFCPGASYVASADADVLLNVAIIVRRLATKPRQNYAEGNLIIKAKPFRGSVNPKWHTSKAVYPEPTYAPYFSGVCYVLSADAAAGVFRESVHVRFLPWDDAYVGLVLQRLGVELRDVPGYLRCRQTEAGIERALAAGPAVLVGANDTNHAGWEKGQGARLKQIWERVAKKQNDGTKHKHTSSKITREQSNDARSTEVHSKN